jgi:hypothetical protein
MQVLTPGRVSVRLGRRYCRDWSNAGRWSCHRRPRSHRRRDVGLVCERADKGLHSRLYRRLHRHLREAVGRRDIVRQSFSLEDVIKASALEVGQVSEAPVCRCGLQQRDPTGFERVMLEVLEV